MAKNNNISDKVLEFYIDTLWKTTNVKKSGGIPPEIPVLLQDPEHLLLILTELQALRSAKEV